MYLKPKNNMTLSVENIEKVCKQLEIPEVQYLGNGLYRMPEGIICRKNFLRDFYKEMLKSVQNNNYAYIHN